MIRDYLRDTRLLATDQPNRSAEALYYTMITACESFCERLLHKSRTTPRIAVTYSAQRKCELVELGSARILVYDQNLGQALNTFNRIVFFAKDSISAYRPMLRILVDEAIVLGRIDLATFFIAKNNKFAGTWDLPPAVSDPFVQTQTWLQELFVFAHEYCHLLMSADNSFRAHRAKVGRIIWEPLEERAPAEIRAGLLERYGEAPAIEEIAEQFSFVQDTVKSSENDLVEELGCDDFAFYTLATYGNSVSLPPVDFFKATFLVLRHVRAINYLRAFMRQLAEGAEPDGIDRRVALLQARQHQLRHAFPAMLTAIQSESSRTELRQLTAEAVHDEISELSDLHDEKIDNVLLFELLPNLAQEFLDWKRRYNRPDQHDIAQCRQLALVRGWAFQLEEISYVSFPKE